MLYDWVYLSRTDTQGKGEVLNQTLGASTVLELTVD